MQTKESRRKMHENKIQGKILSAHLQGVCYKYWYVTWHPEVISLRCKRRREGEEGEGGGEKEKRKRGLGRREAKGAPAVKALITPFFYIQNLYVKC